MGSYTFTPAQTGLSIGATIDNPCIDISSGYKCSLKRNYGSIHPGGSTTDPTDCVGIGGHWHQQIKDSLDI